MDGGGWNGRGRLEWTGEVGIDGGRLEWTGGGWNRRGEVGIDGGRLE